MIAWAHVLQPRELGALTIVVAAQEIIFSGAFMWWSHSVLRFLPRYEISDKRHAFLNTEVAVVAFCGLVQVVLVLVFMEVYFGGEVAGSVKLAAAVSIFFRSTSLYFSERARSTQAILNYTILQAAVPAAGLAISLVLAEKIPATVETMLYALALPQALGLLWVAFRSDFMSSVGRPDREIVREALSFGIPVSLGALIGALALNSPRFIVDQMLGLEAAGAFGVSYGLGLRASNIAVMLVTAAAYPLVVRKMETEGWDAALRQLSSNTILVALIVCPAALGLLAVNGSVIKLIMPESMQHVGVLILPLSTLCGLIRYLRSHTTDQVFLISRRSDVVLKMAAIDFVLCVALALLCTAYMGMVGTVVGALVTATIIWSGGIFLASKAGFRFPLSATLRIVAATLAMMGVVGALPNTGSWLSLLGYVALGAAVYTLAIALLFPDYSRRTLRRAMQKS